MNYYFGNVSDKLSISHKLSVINHLSVSNVKSHFEIEFTLLSRANVLFIFYKIYITHMKNTLRNYEKHIDNIANSI